jgi:hypothetical protein
MHLLPRNDLDLVQVILDAEYRVHVIQILCHKDKFSFLESYFPSLKRSVRALHGGRRETKDRNLKETAFRDFRSDWHDLLNGTRSLGALDPAKSAARSDLKILSFIFLLDYVPEIKQVLANWSATSG